MTERLLRQATRTHDGRDQAERIEHLEAEVKALRAELARVREADSAQRRAFVAEVEREMERLHV